VARRHTNVPHIGGQQGELGLDIGALPVPTQQCIDGEAVSLMPTSA
jgi:hypothetical protein